jgi:putative membrane protein
MMYYGNGMGTGWLMMVIFAIVLPALAIAAGLIAVPLWRGPAKPPAANRASEAELLLGDRFARGEIDTEEYEQRLRTLRAAHS